MRRQVNIDVAPTPDELADALAEMDSRAQARFFNRLGKRDFWPLQLQYIVDTKELTSEGRHIMGLIGDYGRSG